MTVQPACSVPGCPCWAPGRAAWPASARAPAAGPRGVGKGGGDELGTRGRPAGQLAVGPQQGSLPSAPAGWLEAELVGRAVHRERAPHSLRNFPRSALHGRPSRRAAGHLFRLPCALSIRILRVDAVSPVTSGGRAPLWEQSCDMGWRCRGVVLLLAAAIGVSHAYRIHIDTPFESLECPEGE